MLLEGFRHVWLHVLLLLIYRSLQNNNWKPIVPSHDDSVALIKRALHVLCAHCAHGLLFYTAIGFNVETITCKNLKFQVWDLGGQTSIRFVRCCFSFCLKRVKSEKVDYWFLLSDDSCNFCLLFHLCVWPHLTSSFCSTGPTGGAITQTQMRLYTSSTAATATGWASQSPSWWPCWRWRRVERVELSHRNSRQNGLSFILHAFRIMCTVFSPGRRAEESHLGGVCK